MQATTRRGRPQNDRPGYRTAHIIVENSVRIVPANSGIISLYHIVESFITV